MIVKGKDIIGLNVVTVDTGTVIETVDDIAYDPTNHRIIALLVSSGGLFSSAKAIHMDDVRNIGEDAVIVQDASVMQSIKDLGDDVRSISDSNKHLVKTNVLTVDGKELGRVTDMYLDSRTGMVESMEVSQGGLKTMTEGKKSIKPADIVTIGADATIVSNYTEMKLEEQGEEGGLKGMLNDAKDKTAAFAEDAKEAIQDAADKTADTARDMTEAAKDKAEELREQAEVKGREAQKVLQEKADQTKVAADRAARDIRERSDDMADKASVKAEELKRDATVRMDEARDALEHKAAEAKVNAERMRDDISSKAKELEDQARLKAHQMREESGDNASRMRERATDMAETVKDKSRELSDVAEAKTDEARSKVKDVANEAQKEMKDGQEKLETKLSDKSGTADHSGRKVVEETRRYEDDSKTVETKKKVTEK